MAARTVKKQKKTINHVNHVGNLPIPSPCAYECKPTSIKLTPKNVNKIAEYPQNATALKRNLPFKPGIIRKCRITA
jgi:hypothetical protein